jgi:hypothetical protein
MRTGDKKLFLDKDRLYKMINLRMNGYAYTTLAGIFHCDISSVRHQCKKYEIQPVEPIYSLERIVSDILEETEPNEIEWEIMYGEKISKGKTYEEYLAAAGYPHIKNSSNLI